ncbi:MAG TPA: DUF4384 domain-containing protein [Blastocatellia bacterium]|nr:DUF4384 domain-containing protein [Blastocatellia bacterium]
MASRPPRTVTKTAHHRPATKIALGFTLITRDSNNKAVRVPSSHAFNIGDRVRLLIESNMNGHLYIFDREDDGELEMIFPDARIRRGDGTVEAHVPLAVPKRSNPTNAEGDWFTVTGTNTRERIYLVFSKQALQSWPNGVDLLKHPRGFQTAFADFKRVTEWDEGPTVMDAPEPDGVPVSAEEQISLNRGLKLTSDDPLPSFVKIIPDSNRVLTIEIELKRK